MVSASKHVTDQLVVGGGVIGLSLAWELARRGNTVTLLDRQRPGQAASWAGAGILPPPPGPGADHPLDDLARLACRLHENWSGELLEATGIDNGYRRCGGLYLARRMGEVVALRASMASWREEGASPEQLANDQLLEIEPGLSGAVAANSIKAAYWFPDESQLRNPRHLKALVAACESAGVEIVCHSEAKQCLRDGEGWTIQTTGPTVHARQVCITSGAWTRLLVDAFDASINVVPIRGQMILFRLDQPPLTRILNEGPRYLVPRDDGYVLAGSTEEEAGFDASTTSDGLEGISEFASSWLSDLSQARIVDQWAGLRPGSVDGFPYMGSIPDQPGLFVSAGHFRSGLYLSPAAATAMADLMTDQAPAIDLNPFRVRRGLHRAGL